MKKARKIVCNVLATQSFVIETSFWWCAICKNNKSESEEENNMTFGEKIQKLRKEAGLSQEELSYQLKFQDRQSVNGNNI